MPLSRKIAVMTLQFRFKASAKLIAANTPTRL